jgi:hypothetical protein
LTVACHVVGYQPKEVFPKQERVSGGQLGNYVRLPLNGYLHDPPPDSCRKFLHTQCLEQMDDDRAQTVDLERLASWLPEPRAGEVVIDAQAGLHAEDAVRRLGGLAYRIWRDGPLPGSDRSTTLVHLAKVSAEGGLSPDETWAVITSADERWGKGFLNRGDAGVDIVRKIVNTAYL